MGFFTKADPIAKLKAEVEAKPKDTKLLLDLAGQLKAKGALTEAGHYYFQAADALNAQGFASKATAIIRQVTQMAPKSVAAHEKLAEALDAAKAKEDLRGVLKTLVSLYRGEGRMDDAATAQAKIDALGPGR